MKSPFPGPDTKGEHRALKGVKKNTQVVQIYRQVPKVLERNQNNQLGTIFFPILVLLT